MGNRVALIGGKTVGRDHFPWPVRDAVSDDLATASEWPFPLGIVNACNMLLRVRKWKITVDDVVNHHSDPTPETYAGFVFYLELGNIFEENESTDPGDGLARESSLVVPFGATSFSEVHEYSSGIEAHAFLQGVLYLRQYDGIHPSGFDFANPVFASGQVRPYFVFGLAYDTSDGDTPDFEVNAATTNLFPTPSFDPCGTLKLSLPGLAPVEINMYSDEGAGIFEVSVTVEPIVFWPYATKGGLPVYDTSTGAQIRDPFS